MTSEKSWRVFLGSFILLIISYLVYFVRYPMWQFFTSVEPIFAMLILSYLVVLIVPLVLLKTDSKKSLTNIFKLHDSRMTVVALVLAVLFHALWILISLGMGSKLEVVSFPSLKGYENYAFYSLPIAFAFYLAFSVFGAFAEEVAYRGYVQSRISSKYGYIVSIFGSTLLFSLQHIHIFQLNWVERFFQTQFIYVLSFGVFVGYLFFKSKEDIWSVFAFHALINISNVSLPIQVTNVSTFSSPFATITSFILLILVLRFLPSGHEGFSTA